MKGMNIVPRTSQNNVGWYLPNIWAVSAAAAGLMSELSRFNLMMVSDLLDQKKA